MTNLNSLLLSEGIKVYGIIGFDKLNVINPRLIKDAVNIKSALVFLIPYRHEDMARSDNFNVGLFARCKDYHRYADLLFGRLAPKLKSAVGGEVYGFADHSPIDEKDAALKTGLGFMGKNGLIINEEYGSFVFIAELLFTESLEERILRCGASCGACSACVRACPTEALKGGGFPRERCLSAISQKKKKTVCELKLLKDTATVWGCDICQNACPYNKNALYSDIEYFKDGFIESFSEERLCGMSDEEYKCYAFSFRPRSVLQENFLTAKGRYGIIQG